MIQLDLGCGNTPRPLDGVTEIWGVDIAHGASITNPCVKQGYDLAMEPIPFGNDRFDVVTAYDFMEHIPATAYEPMPGGRIHKRNCMIELFNEIYRVLKPGGRFLMRSPVWPNPAVFQDPTHVFVWTMDTVNYFSGDYFGFHEHYGHISRFEKVQNTNDNGWLVIVLRAIKSLPPEAPYTLTYPGVAE